MEICQFYKKVCSGDKGLSLHMYHNKECFQKMTNMTKEFHKYALVHSHFSCNQEFVHQNKKVKVNRDSKQSGIILIFFNAQTRMQSLTRLKPFILPYAEIGASFNNSHFGLLLWGGCFVCCFKFGCIQNIVSR